MMWTEFGQGDNFGGIHTAAARTHATARQTPATSSASSPAGRTTAPSPALYECSRQRASALRCSTTQWQLPIPTSVRPMVVRQGRVACPVNPAIGAAVRDQQRTQVAGGVEVVHHSGRPGGHFPPRLPTRRSGVRAGAAPCCPFVGPSRRGVLPGSVPPPEPQRRSPAAAGRSSRAGRDARRPWSAVDLRPREVRGQHHSPG